MAGAAPQAASEGEEQGPPSPTGEDAADLDPVAVSQALVEHRSLAELAHAVERAEQLLERAETTDEDRLYLLYGLCSAYRQLKQFDRASAAAESMRAAAGGNPYFEAAATMTRAQLGNALGQADRVWVELAALDAQLEPMRATLVGMGLSELEADEAVMGFEIGGWSVAADLAIIRGDPVAGIEGGEELLATCLERGLNASYRNAAQYLGNLKAIEARSFAMVDPEAAARAKARAEELLGGLLDESQGAISSFGELRARAALASLHFTFGELERARAMIEGARALAPDEADEQGEIELTFAQLDALQAIIQLAEGADPAGLAGQVEGSFAALVASWRSTPVYEGGVGFLSHFRRRDIVEQFIGFELQAFGDGAAGRVLERLAELQACGTLERGLPGIERRPSLAAIQSALVPAGGGCLVYFPGPERLWVVAVDADGARAFSGPSIETRRRELRDVGRDLRAKLDRRGPASIREKRVRSASAALLPAAVRAQLGSWGSVVVVGRDLVENVDFEVLELAPGRPLGLELALSYLPSLPAGLALAERAALRLERGPGPRSLLIADGALGPDAAAVEPIVLGSRWTEGWRADLGPGELLRGPDAAPHWLETHWGGDSDYLLLYAHGARDPGLPRPAQLLLYPDAGSGALDCSAIEALSGGGIVNLAACGAAMAFSRVGDSGTLHLGGAFLAAGAEAVLVSAAPLNAAATNALLDHLHAELGRGSSSAEALLVARRKLAASAEFSDPHFWANLQVYGFGGARLLPVERARPIAVAAAAAAAAAAGLGLLLALRARRKRRSPAPTGVEAGLRASP